MSPSLYTASLIHVKFNFLSIIIRMCLTILEWVKS